MRVGRAIAFVTLTATAFIPERSGWAAGLFVSERGVRPLGRGGAFVAGADDLGAIWYNPAGLVDAPSSLLVDASWVDYSTEFTRSVVTTSASGAVFTQRQPTVRGTTPFLPIPTIVGSLRFGDHDQYAAALGVYGPYSALLSYPESIVGADGTARPAPQRYSLLSLNGSALAIGGAWFAYRPVEQLRIGAGVQMLAGFFKTTTVFSACPADQLVCASEDPTYDARGSINAGPILAPSANVGVTVVPVEFVRVGASFQAPFMISTPATFGVTLPAAAIFDNAYIQGNRAHLSLEFPPIVRVGLEVRPRPDLRIEVAWVREFWSVQRSLDVTPENVALYKATGFPSPLALGKITIPRHFTDADSFRLGAEWTFPVAGYAVQARAGAAYETSAVPIGYESPLTVDRDKVQVTLGASVHVSRRLRLDAVYARTIMASVDVSARDAAIPKINPVKGYPTASPPDNAGLYTADTNIIGLGMEYRFQ